MPTQNLKEFYDAQPPVAQTLGEGVGRIGRFLAASAQNDARLVGQAGRALYEAPISPAAPAVANTISKLVAGVQSGFTGDTYRPQQFKALSIKDMVGGNTPAVTTPAIAKPTAKPATPATQQAATATQSIAAAPKPVTPGTAPGTTKPRRNVIASIATPPTPATPMLTPQPASPVIAGVQIEPGPAAANPNIAAQRISNQADLNNGKYFYTGPHGSQPRSNSYTIGFNGDAPSITANGRVVPASAPTTAAEDEAGARTVDEIRGRMPGVIQNEGKLTYDTGGIDRITPQNKADAYNASIKGLSDKFTAGEANTLPKNTISLLAQNLQNEGSANTANIHADASRSIASMREGGENVRLDKTLAAKTTGLTEKDVLDGYSAYLAAKKGDLSGEPVMGFQDYRTSVTGGGATGGTELVVGTTRKANGKVYRWDGKGWKEAK